MSALFHLVSQEPATQEPTVTFFGPVLASYGAAMGLWWLTTRVFSQWWPEKGG